MFSKEHSEQNKTVYEAALDLARSQLPQTADWKAAALFSRTDLTAKLCEQFPHIPWRRVRSQAIRAGRVIFHEKGDTTK